MGTNGTWGSFVGQDNNNQVYNNYGVATGGQNNTAGIPNNNPANAFAQQQYATVSGGVQNTASGGYSMVGGGSQNTANGVGTTVAGGLQNTASGNFATVPGGYSNIASGEYSFAAGNRAMTQSAVSPHRPLSLPTIYNGAFVWADSSNFDFNSAASNEFAVRATGGVRFVTAINSTTGA